MLVGKCCDVLKWAAVEVDVWVGVVNNFKLGFVILLVIWDIKLSTQKCLVLEGA